MTRHSFNYTMAILVAISISSGDAFQPSLPTSSTSRTVPPASPTAVFGGGFGGGGGAGKKKKADKGSSGGAKPKPKQQWDRYLDMKTESKIPVGVRIKDEADEEWLEIGRVRSKEGAYTSIAVALQRALIAEHAKRLFPLQVSNKKTLEWAFMADDSWTIVDKAILDEQTLPEGIEKLIGFEGRPDPATGFYCVYDGGRLKVGEETSFN